MSSDPPGLPHDSAPILVLAPRRGWQPLDLGELWRSRELVWILALRDLKVRYRQTVLGAAWAVLQPLLTMAVFSLVFGRLARMPSDGVPYPLFAFCALLPWQLFSSALTQAGGSLVGSRALLTKVYFPRLAIPVSAMLPALVDFAVSFVALAALMLYYGVAPGAAALALPAFLGLACAAALGAGVWLSALNVEYRDVRYVIPFLTQFLMFATPIAYPASLLPSGWRWLFGLNPMTGVVEGFRWSLLGAPGVLRDVLPASILSTTVLLVSGIFYFRRMERGFSDVV